MHHYTDWFEKKLVLFSYIDLPLKLSTLIDVRNSDKDWASLFIVLDRSLLKVEIEKYLLL